MSSLTYWRTGHCFNLISGQVWSPLYMCIHICYIVLQCFCSLVILPCEVMTYHMNTDIPWLLLHWFALILSLALISSQNVHWRILFLRICQLGNVIPTFKGNSHMGVVWNVALNWIVSKYYYDCHSSAQSLLEGSHKRRMGVKPGINYTQFREISMFTHLLLCSGGDRVYFDFSSLLIHIYIYIIHTFYCKVTYPLKEWFSPYSDIYTQHNQTKWVTEMFSWILEIGLFVLLNYVPVSYMEPFRRPMLLSRKARYVVGLAFKSTSHLWTFAYLVVRLTYVWIKFCFQKWSDCR